jgi:hypothetical protein
MLRVMKQDTWLYHVSLIWLAIVVGATALAIFAH